MTPHDFDSAAALLSFGGLMALVAAAWDAEEHRKAVVEYFGILSSARPALDLRQARVLAWFRAQDLTQLSYPGWLAFVKERVDWAESWTRGLIALIRSGLTEVIRAVCEGRLAVAAAIRAPTTCPPEAHAQWIVAARAGEIPKPFRRPSGASSTVELDETDTLLVWYARHKVRLLEGLPLDDREADERMLTWWRNKRDPADIVATAIAPAPKPRVAPGDAPGALDWPFADKAEALLGPWHTPTDLADGLRQLETVQAARSGRLLQLGCLYEHVVRNGLYNRWKFPTVEAFCQQTMGLCARSLQRHQSLGRAVHRFPALAEAAEKGMALSRVVAVGRMATEDDIERWIAVAGRTPVRELEQASAHVFAGADSDALLAAYEVLMASTTHTVALGAVQAPVPPPLTDRVHPDLPAAAHWLLQIELPPQRGFGKVKVRDSFICANPECRRRGLRNHAHHIDPRQYGGSDNPKNGITVCPSCHLRLLHTDLIRFEQVGENQVWTYLDRTVIVAPGPKDACHYRYL